MSGQIADSSSTYLELGWSSAHIKLGIGYDSTGRQLREVAVQGFNPQNLQQSGKPDRVTNVHSISTSEELKSRIQADLKANIPLEGASIKTENSYLSSLEISKTSLTQVIQETWTGKPTTLDVHQLQLTDDARAILEQPGGWQLFKTKYGEYFVYGFVPRARFSAIVNIKTSSESTRNEIKSSLELGVDKIGGIGATLESVKSSKKDSVNIDINLDVVGLSSSPSGNDDEKPTNKIDDVQKLYQDFSKNYELQPYIGLLCHYSTLSTTTQIPLPINQFAHLGPELNRIYKGLFTAQLEVSDSPMVRAAATGNKVAGLCEKIKNLNLIDAQAIKSMSDDFNACIQEVDAWRLRSDLIDDVKKLRNTNLNSGNWTEGLTQKEWASGVLSPDQTNKYGSLKSEMTHKEAHFRESGFFGKSKKRVCVLGDNDQVILGFKINNYRNDSTNGWFKLHSGNVLDSEVKVEFSSYTTRGCDWELEIWEVSKLMYEKKP